MRPPHFPFLEFYILLFYPLQFNIKIAGLNLFLHFVYIFQRKRLVVSFDTHLNRFVVMFLLLTGDIHLAMFQVSKLKTVEAASKIQEETEEPISDSETSWEKCQILCANICTFCILKPLVRTNFSNELSDCSVCVRDPDQHLYLNSFAKKEGNLPSFWCPVSCNWMPTPLHYYIYPLYFSSSLSLIHIQILSHYFSYCYNIFILIGEERETS